MSIEAAKQAVSLAKINIAREKNNTFFTALVFKLPTVITEDIPTASTDGVLVQYNPEFILGLTPDERVFLVLHETLHVAYDHIGRLDSYQPEKWNKACDYVINAQLIDRNFKMPKGGLYDKAFAGMSANQVYALLPDSDGGGGKGSPQCPWDDLGEPAEKDSYKRSELIKDMVVAAATQAKMANDSGSIPADIAKLVDSILNPVVPWNVVLARFMSEINKDDYSWKKPNRRFMPNHYLPSLHSEALERIDFAIDVSGSINEKQFNQFVGELYFVIRKYKPKKLGIMQFDHKVQSSNVLSNPRQLLSLPFKGGGGTYLEPVMQEFLKSPAKTLIVLTDGYFSTSITNPKKKVIWIVYDNADFKPPFGTAIHFSLKV